jgi:hypothetical protein
LTAHLQHEMGKSGHVRRLEPKGPEIMEEDVDLWAMFEQVGWYPYLTILEGTHYEVSIYFSKIFNGQRANVGGLEMEVTEGFIVEACHIPTDEEKWFKNKRITGGDVNPFMEPKLKDPNWSKGIPKDWLVGDWLDTLKMGSRLFLA